MHVENSRNLYHHPPINDPVYNMRTYRSNSTLKKKDLLGKGYHDRIITFTHQNELKYNI